MNLKLMVQSALISALTVIVMFSIQDCRKIRQQLLDDTPRPCFVIESGKIQAIADTYTLKEGCVVYSMNASPERVCCGDCNVISFPRRVCDAALMEMTKSELPNAKETN